MDTIFALATAQGRSGVAIIRVSGPQSIEIVEKFCVTVPNNRGVRKVFTKDKTLIDEALILNFPKNKSFTGEQIVELHLHGSPVIISTVLRELTHHTDARQADSGEFTRRAFENGRLDLAQVEGLSDLLEAETEYQRRQAMKIFSGELGDKVAIWREKLIRAAALLEATIDFVDEDVPIDVYPEVKYLLKDVATQMKFEADGVYVAERLKEGFEVAIIGAPNVGKSTFLNKLSGREAAITSHYAGTTRDIIEVKMDIKGIPVTFLDTAGLRSTSNEIEKIGVQRTLERSALADLRLYIKEDEEEYRAELLSEDLVVWAKSDLYKRDGLSISGLTGEGVENIMNKVFDIFSNKVSSTGVAIKERHKTSIEQSLKLIYEANNKIKDGFSTDFVSEDLRCAISSVNSLIGYVDVDHVLDEVFSSFCIGK